MGHFFFHIMGALAEMERELIVGRTRAVPARYQGATVYRWQASKAPPGAMGAGRMPDWGSSTATAGSDYL